MAQKKRLATKKSVRSWWRILLYSIAAIQLCVILCLFLSQPESVLSSSNGSHVSPHHLDQLNANLERIPLSSSSIQTPNNNNKLKDTTIDKGEEDAGGFNLDGHLDAVQLMKSTTLPVWIKDYFSWHAQQLASLTADNWQDHKFLILQCIREDPHCGGASDRLKPIPLLLWVAQQTGRIFLIWWTRPCPLEEFLVPNALNWTVPDFLPLQDAAQNGRIFLKLHVLLDKSHANLPIIRTKMQTYHGGQLDFDNRTDSTYDEVYHELFRLFFRPSPPIAQILLDEMSAVHLRPGHYAVAHYRAFYGREGRKESTIAKVAVNAVNCASMLRPGGPVYFASDSTFAVKTVQDYAKTNDYPIVTIQNQEPLHLDKAGNWSTRHPSDFYSIFVDLYLMGMGRCVTFGQGGFGRFGLLLSYNATCASRHIHKRQLSNCHWTTENDNDSIRRR